MACYLFDCGKPNICVFSSHPGFSVVQYPLRHTSDREQEKHADDLYKLTTTTLPSTRIIKTTLPADKSQGLPLFTLLYLFAFEINLQKLT